MAGALLPAPVTFLKPQHFPTVGRRYLSAPADFPSINAAAHVCEVSARRLVSAWPLTELIFPFTLCEGHLQRGREAKRQEGTNQREGERRAGSEEERKKEKAKQRRVGGKKKEKKKKAVKRE